MYALQMIHSLFSSFSRSYQESKLPKPNLLSFFNFLVGTSWVLAVLMGVVSSCKLRYLPTPSLNTLRGCLEAFLGLTPGPSASAFFFNSSALSAASWGRNNITLTSNYIQGYILDLYTISNFLLFIKILWRWLYKFKIKFILYFYKISTHDHDVTSHNLQYEEEVHPWAVPIYLRSLSTSLFFFLNRALLLILNWIFFNLNNAL